MSVAHPRISVVIPAYRCADTILDVLNALFVQTLPCFEIVVVNDNSPDNLKERLQPVMDGIVYVENEKNLRLSKTYNRGIKASKGEYVLTLHSDCLLEPRYVEKLYPLLANDETTGAVTGQYQFHRFDEMNTNDQLFTVLNRLPIKPEWTSAIEEISFIEGKADLFRRKDLDRFGLFDERLSLTAEDQDLSAKYRASAFRVLINHEATFSAQYNATQDSLWKILRKQRTYARGQGYVLWEYGSHAVKLTTRNRNVRAVHRMSQVLVSGSELLLAIIGAWFPLSFAALGLLLVLRAAYYYAIAASMRLPARLLAMPCGLLGDHLYTFGLLQGTFLYFTIKKV